MAKKSGVFIRQFVVGVGFISGVFTAIGIDPQGEIIRVIGKAVGSVYPDPQVSYLFFILPTILLVISVVAAYLKGKALGLLSVIVAYGSGILILVSIVFSLVLLAFAVLLGYLATNRRLLKKVII
jgi:ABC-type multidrug transport system permease subunit